MRLQLNPEMLLYPFDGAGTMPRVVCELPHSSGRPVRFLLPSSTLSLIEGCSDASDLSAFASSMLERSGGRLSIQQCATLVESQLMPRGIVVDLDAPRVVSDMKRRDQYLTLKIRIFSPVVVRFIADRLVWLCKSGVVVSVLAVALLAHVAVYSYAYKLKLLNLAALTGKDAVLIVVLMMSQVLWHEIGHATALVRYGGKKPEIGWGLYLWYSVFFTDLSEAWQMSRVQRVHIDLAGMYFQSVFLLLFAYLAIKTHSHLWLYAFYVSDLHLATNFNPFLRLDGYWALIDALGLTSLRGTSVGQILRGDKQGESVSFTTLPRSTQRIAKAYILCSVGFYSVLLVFLAWQIRKLALDLHPLFTAWRHVVNLHQDRTIELRFFFSMLGKDLLFLVTCAILLRMASRLVQTMRPEPLTPRISFIARRRSPRASHAA